MDDEGKKPKKPAGESEDASATNPNFSNDPEYIEWKKKWDASEDLRKRMWAGIPEDVDLEGHENQTDSNDSQVLMIDEIIQPVNYELEVWKSQIIRARLDKTKRYDFKLGDGTLFQGTPEELLQRIEEGKWSRIAIVFCRIPTALPEGQDPPAEHVEHYTKYLKQWVLPGQKRVQLFYHDGSGFDGSIEDAARYIARRFVALNDSYEIEESYYGDDPAGPWFEILPPIDPGLETEMVAYVKDPRF